MAPFSYTHACACAHANLKANSHYKSYYNSVNAYKGDCKNVAQTIDSEELWGQGMCVMCVYLCVMGVHTEMGLKGSFPKSSMCILLLNLI